MNYHNLRVRIFDKFGSLRNFAKALDCSVANISSLMRKGSLSTKTIFKWADILDISQDDIGHYFFNQNVSE